LSHRVLDNHAFTSSFLQRRTSEIAGGASTFVFLVVGDRTAGTIRNR
jgi:hypothetical protein